MTALCATYYRDGRERSKKKMHTHVRAFSSDFFFILRTTILFIFSIIFTSAAIDTMPTASSAIRPFFPHSTYYTIIVSYCLPTSSTAIIYCFPLRLTSNIPASFVL